MGKPNGNAAPPPDHNEAGLREEIAEHTAEIINLEERRAEVNAKINAKRKAIKALKIDMDAWRAAKRRREMDPDVRAEFDRSATLCNAALGVPVQAELFPQPAADGTIPGGLHH